MDVNFIDLLRIVIRSLLSLFTLFLVTKMIGKRQVSQLSLFDYVIGISIGNFAAEMIVNLDSNFLNGTVAVLMFGCVAYFISFLSMKSISLRRFFMGTPTILIDKGVLLQGSMKKFKIDVNDLLEQAREAGCFDISNILYAILEADGKISFLFKEDVSGGKKGLCANVIIDGNIMRENLKNIGKSEEWLLDELKSKDIDYFNVLLGIVTFDDEFIVYKKNDRFGKDILE